MNEHFEPKRLFSYLFIVGIAVLFALQWGPGSRGCDSFSKVKEDVAASVNGKPITLQEFNRSYANYLGYMRMQGQAIPDQLAKQLGMPKQVLEQLVNTELLAQAAEKTGLTASDAELREIIVKNPDFQKDGKFDVARYREVLRDYYRRTDVDYETDLRRRLAAQKMMSLVEAAANVSADEVKARFYKDGNKANVRYVRFSPVMFAGSAPAPSQDEGAAFAKAHAAEVADYYNANRLTYQQPERVHARHILFKVARDAPKEQQDEAREKAENLKKQLAAGKDFAQAAKEFSEDTGSKESGGDLGFNERGSWVPEFSQVAFSLAKGEVSQPVQTQFGFHLIKVEDKKAPESRELAQVEKEIGAQLLSRQKAKDSARAEAEKALAAVKAGKDLKDLYPPDASEPQGPMAAFKAKSKPEAAETGDFSSSGETVPMLGPAPELAKAVFALERPGALGQVYEVGDGFVVAVVIERKMPSDADFAAQKDQLFLEALKGKQFELRDAYLKALKKSAQVVTNEELVSQSAAEG